MKISEAFEGKDSSLRRAFEDVTTNDTTTQNSYLDVSCPVCGNRNSNGHLCNFLESWKEEFKREFGIHFSESELKFVLSFIENLLEKNKKVL